MAMTKRQRVLAALAGSPVDRVPLGFWRHHFTAENTAEGLAAETLRLGRTHDWDYLKPQSRAQCFAEMWGLTYRASAEAATPYTITHAPVAEAADLARIAPVNPRTGALGEQLEALRLIRARVGADTPIVWTVFSPLMVLAYLVAGGRDRALALARTAPTTVEGALEAIAETLAGYARECLEAGADGLFYASNVTARDVLSAEECRRWHRRFDLTVLGAAAAAPFNVMHVCGPGAHFDEFADYPVAAFSWAAGDDNPTLADGHERTGRAVLGGLPAKAAFASATPEDIARRVRSAIAALQGRWLLLGPDCSVDPAAAAELFEAARAARDAG